MPQNCKSYTFGGMNIIRFVTFLHRLSQFGTKQLLILFVYRRRKSQNFVYLTQRINSFLFE